MDFPIYQKTNVNRDDLWTIFGIQKIVHNIQDRQGLINSIKIFDCERPKIEKSCDFSLVMIFSDVTTMTSLT